jgi:RepB DNA-primase from phage plasmid
MKKHGRGTLRGADDQARDMLTTFAGVGAQRFDLTLTDAAGGKVEFRPNCPIDWLRTTLGSILRDAATRRHNVIVRPRSEAAALVQLDDLDAAAAQRLRPVSFLILCTSPGNYQAWVALAGPADAEFVRRLRQGAGADPTASGATRVSGSRNFKAKHAPAFPHVETVHTRPGLVVTRAELEAFGVMTLPEKAETTPQPARVSLRRPGPRGWPDYRRCVENAPPAREGGRRDISRADFTWCLLAIDWGWGVEETAARLLQESGKARENGEPYALRTARNAAAAVERRQGRQR